jgi:dethiobiotin synthetase
MRGFFITGTDTDAGKTWFMLKFGEFLLKYGFKFHFLKPVESGCWDNPHSLLDKQQKLFPKDAMLFSNLENVPLNKICKYMFKAYASPPRAAKMENKSIELEEILDFIETNKYQDEDYYNLVEGCGGFYSPIANNKLTSDLAISLNLPVIIVVKNVLGCINHTLLSIHAVKKSGLNVKFIVLNNINEETVLDNYKELSQFTNIPIIRLGFNQGLDSTLLNYIN